MTIPAYLTAAREFVARQTVPMWIDGEPYAARGGQVFTTYEPSEGVPLVDMYEAQTDDVDIAVQSSAQAFEQWRKSSPAERQALLLRLADLVEEHFDEIAAIDSIDYGGAISRTRLGKKRCTDLLRYYASLARVIHGDTIQNSLPYDAFTYTLREPIGVVAAITPWNAPIGSTVWKIAPALAAGCTVIVKPSPEASLSTLRLAELAKEAGFPPGVFNVVTGGAIAGVALTSHPQVAKVSFTGSTETGKAILRDSSAHLTKVTLELGGKSANIVFPDADLAEAARVSAQVAFQNSGQVCAAGTRLYVHESIHDEFVAAVAESTRQLKVGHSLDDETMLGPVVSQSQQERVGRYIELGETEGAELVSGGLLERDGYYVEPAIFCNVQDNMRIAREEIFGPVLSVMKFESEEEVCDRANDSDYGLGAMVWTQNLSRAHRAVQNLAVGTVWVNSPNMLDSALPFGGTKMSGLGRESGMEHILNYVDTKSVMMKV